ncbi:MAG TPA: VWA domain-containing protein [Acidobacteriaceae bacterium]|jgi:VWFA-related protein
MSCFALHGSGQAPAPAAPANAPQAPSPQQNASQTTTIRVNSNLVVIDVVVSDSQGNPVHGLKPSDFALTENSKPQMVRHFEEHTPSPASDTQVAPTPKLPPGLFTNQSAAPVNGPVNVLLLDYLNTPLSAQPYARKQLIDYLNKAPAGTRIAIFGLTTRLTMLQGFTSDMGVLKAALTQSKGAPQASQILTDPVNGGPIGSTTLSDALANDSTAVDGMVTQEMVDSINRFQAMSSSFQQDMRAQYTLNGFDLLARYLVGIPGRKNVIWFSGSFPLNIEPNAAEQDPNDSVVRNDEAVRKTDNLLTRAQVAVYPVDARGVQIDPAMNFASGADSTIGADSGASAASEQMSFQMNTAQEHETMFAMAEDTGGQAFVNTNNLTQAVQKAIENGSNYYTLTYSPTNTQWDARFRTIKIKVDEPNIKLSYRNGYYAIDPNDRNSVTAQKSAMAVVQPTTMATAMMHGGPDPAEILFKVRIRPAAAPPVETPLATNQANPDPRVKVEGPFREYGVDLVPDPHAVSCRQDPAGNRHCSIEVWTFVYNSDGEKLITASNRLHNVMTPAQYAQLLVGGMAFHQEISVPAKGHYYLRTAIHDMVSDKVGAVEVPVAAVSRLDPLHAMAGPGPVPAPTEPTTIPEAAPAPGAPTTDAVPAPAGGAATPK